MLIDWPFPLCSGLHPFCNSFTYKERMRIITINTLKHFASL